MDSVNRLTKVCKVEGCGKKHWGKGYCQNHYAKLPEVREAANARARAYHKATNYEVFKRYEKTKKGFLVRLYRNMQSRIEGVQKQKHHLYEGLSLLPRETFYEWALNSPEFHKLFDEYKSQGYPRKLAPSVDRVNSSLGYFISNMEWVTHSENSRRGTISLNRKKAMLKKAA